MVDDQPNIVDMVAMVLRFHGFTVSTAATARSEIVRAPAQPYCGACERAYTSTSSPEVTVKAPKGS